MNVTVNTDSELIKNIIHKLNISNDKTEKLNLLSDLEYFVHRVCAFFYFILHNFLVIINF